MWLPYASGRETGCVAVQPSLVTARNTGTAYSRHPSACRSRCRTLGHGPPTKVPLWSLCFPKATYFGKPYLPKPTSARVYYPTARRWTGYLRMAAPPSMSAQAVLHAGHRPFEFAEQSCKSSFPKHCGGSDELERPADTAILLPLIETAIIQSVAEICACRVG